MTTDAQALHPQPHATGPADEAPASKEAPRKAACRLAAKQIKSGYQPQALHEYQAADGTTIYWRIRCKHPDGSKWIRPFYWDGACYKLGEPPTPPEGKILYRLPELLVDTDKPVFVSEGENTVDALAKLGLVATTSGSASSAEGGDWTALHGRTVTIWPDNDGAGQKYADDVAAKLKELGCIVRQLDAAALDIPEGGDAVDWLRAHPNASADDVLALATVVAADPATTEPEPLSRPVPPPEPYPLEALGDVLAPAAHSLRRVIQAPDAVCGASVLAAASLATQAQADVLIDGRVYPLSLWLLTVANSGERKSAVDGEAMRAARAFEKDLGQIYEADWAAYQDECAEWKAKCDAAKHDAKNVKGAGLADALGDIGPAPAAPLLARVLTADFTAEGLAKMLSVSLPSIGAFSDEAALVFGGHGMTQEAVMRTAATLCKLWDAGTLDRVRALDGAMKLHGRRLALHLMAQPVIAERALSDDVLAGQGFLARCLLAWPESTAGTRTYQAESLRDDRALQRMTERLLALHRQPLPLAELERQELAPRRLTLAPDAKALWTQLHDTVEAHMASDGNYASVRPWASKTPEQVLRMAGVLTLTDNSDAQQIDAGTIERAIELALWHLNEAVRLAGTAELPPTIRNAQKLLDWCHETGRSLLYSRDALRLGPGSVRSADAFNAAMKVLEKTGWAAPIEGGQVVDGKHQRRVWAITKRQP